MIIDNIRLEGMDDWVDFDVALFRVGRALGVFPCNYEDLPNAKALLWSKNKINECLSQIVNRLVDIGYLEYSEERDQFRINKGFVLTGNES